MVFPFGLTPFPKDSSSCQGLCTASSGSLQSVPSHPAMNLPLSFSISSKSCSQQDSRIFDLSSSLCINSASSSFSSLHWDFKATVWCTALILPPETMRIFAFSGNTFFCCGRKSDIDIYKQRALKEHLGQQVSNRGISWPVSTLLPLETHPQSHKQSKEQEHQRFSRNSHPASQSNCYVPLPATLFCAEPSFALRHQTLPNFEEVWIQIWSLQSKHTSSIMMKKEGMYWSRTQTNFFQKSL